MTLDRGLSRPRRRRLALLLALSPLAACSVGPDVKTPEAPIVASWRDAHAAGIKTSREDYREWWKAFRDPTLNRLVDRAYDQNLTLMEAGTRVLKARAIFAQAVGEVYPQTQQLSGTLDYMKLPSTDAAVNPDNGITKNFTRVNLGGQAAWELDLWGKFRHGVEAADASYLASIASYDDVLVSMIGDVASDYIAIRTLQAQIRIAQENVVKQKEALAIAQSRFKGGATSELDVFQAQNVLAQTQAAVPQYSAALAKQIDALAVLLGEPPQNIDAFLRGARAIPAPPPTVSVGIPADLLRRRPDVRAAELKAIAQGAQVGMAEAELYPAFSLTGALGTAASTTPGNSLKSLFTQPSLTFAFGPSFSWPILNYGQITNQVRAEDAQLQGLLLAYKNSVLNAQREVQDGLSGFVQGRIQVGYLQQSVKAANDALTVSLAQYQLGSRDFTTVLTAEQNLYTAQNNLAAAQGNVAQNLTGAYRALGGGWQIRWGRDFVPDSVRDEMRARTNWGEVLPPADKTPPTPGLPGPSDLGPTVRPPQW